MTFKKGQRVRHPKIAAWGLGQVLEDTRDENVRVFFVGAGEKTISTLYVQLEQVSGADAGHPTLDNLKQSPSPGIRYRSLPESIQFFLERYPEGFYGTKFLADERNYKVAAHDLFEKMLSKAALDRLLNDEAYGEVCQRAQKVMQATNLVFPNEKMALNDGLKVPEGQKVFATALADLVHGPGADEQRLAGFCDALRTLDALKWTTATYFLFIAKPQKYMFVKPTVTQSAASTCGFEISYKPEPNWLTYSRVQKLSETLFGQLAELKPRDMIDVQSFMWCIAPEI